MLLIGSTIPDHAEGPQLTSPIGPDGVDAGRLTDIAERLFGTKQSGKH